jgi:hypothetical protein
MKLRKEIKERKKERKRATDARCVSSKLNFYEN